MSILGLLEVAFGLAVSLLTVFCGLLSIPFLMPPQRAEGAIAMETIREQKKRESVLEQDPERVKALLEILDEANEFEELSGFYQHEPHNSNNLHSRYIRHLKAAEKGYPINAAILGVNFAHGYYYNNDDLGITLGRIPEYFPLEDVEEILDNFPKELKPYLTISFVHSVEFLQEFSVKGFLSHAFEGRFKMYDWQ